MSHPADSEVLMFHSGKTFPRRSHQGFTYLGLLFAIVLIGLALVLGSEVWSTNRQREKELELLFIGHQFRDAIGRYYEESPFGEKVFPRSLEELIQDPRFPGIKRYLRRIYVDPMTEKSEWGLVMSDHGGIQGIYSLSSNPTIKSSNFAEQDQTLDGKTMYSNWKFEYIPNSGIANPVPAPNGEESMESGGEGSPPQDTQE